MMFLLLRGFFVFVVEIVKMKLENLRILHSNIHMCFVSNTHSPTFINFETFYTRLFSYSNAARRESRPKAGFRGGQVGLVENRAPFFGAKSSPFT